jgi:hypothetical protein
MAQETKRFWVLGDGEGFVGTVIPNGVHLVTISETRSKVKVVRAGKTGRNILRRHWDSLPKVPCTGQPFSEALASLRACEYADPRKRKQRKKS